MKNWELDIKFWPLGYFRSFLVTRSAVANSCTWNDKVTFHLEIFFFAKGLNHNTFRMFDTQLQFHMKVLCQDNRWIPIIDLRLNFTVCLPTALDKIGYLNDFCIKLILIHCESKWFIYIHYFFVYQVCFPYNFVQVVTFFYFHFSIFIQNKVSCSRWYISIPVTILFYRSTIIRLYAFFTWVLQEYTLKLFSK